MTTNGSSMVSLLVLVDRAIGGTGPHRNVVGTLNALSKRSDVSTTVFCGSYDTSEPFAHTSKIRFLVGFNPKSVLRAPLNLFRVLSLSIRADVIYVPCGFISALYGAFAARILNRKIIIGPNVSKLPWRKVDSPGIFEVGFLTDIWLEASQKRRDFVLKHLPEQLRPKVTNILHSIDLEKFNPKHRSLNFFPALNIREKSIKILHVGRDNEPIKGVHILIEAINLLNNNWSDKVDFIIVGKMSESTRSIAKKHQNVHFLGFRSGQELSSIFASSDLAIVPSSWENCPFTVLEALASGLPVIAFRTGGIPELIDSEQTGLLVDGVDAQGKHKKEAAENLAKATSELLENLDRLKKMSHLARATAEKKFSEDRLGEELVQLIKRIKNN